jgi:hypothetical protein
MIFLDISKAFDRVYHAGLMHKLESFGISGNLLQLLGDYLSDIQQRVVLNGKRFNCVTLTQGYLKSLFWVPYFS